MKKKILLIAGLCLGSTGPAIAEGFVYHVGSGYYASFLGTPLRVSSDSGEKNASDLKGMPLGLSQSVGVGYGFGSEKKFSVGGEGVAGWVRSLNPSGIDVLSLQVRVFGRYVPFKEFFNVTGFAGFKSNLPLSKRKIPSGANHPVFGIRLDSAYFFYLEYAVVLRGNFSGVYSHDIAIGFMSSW